MSAARTLFLHCGWRTASTYLWSRVRASGQVVAYNEPFHETLARRTGASGGFARALRNHPDVPAFAEYDALVENGAVRGYETRFATRTFFLAPEQDDAALEHYVRGLETHARAQDKNAAFAFCRSLGRVAWLRQRFPDAWNVVLVRRPYDHWRSSLEQFAKGGVAYFLVMPLRIIAENRHVPELTRLAERHAIPDDHAAQIALLQRLPADAVLRLFFEVYALGYAHALTHADQMIEIERFVDEAEYRDASIAEIARETGIQITPGEMNLTRYAPSGRDVFSALDLDALTTLAASAGPVVRGEEAVTRYRALLAEDSERVRAG